MAKKPSAQREEIDRLLERIAALEARIRRLEGEHDAAVGAAADFAVGSMPAPPRSGTLVPAAPAVSPAAAALEPGEPIAEETLIVISAAVAAFLGERAHVRQVRLVHSDAWAQQGRVSVMASHRWAVHR